MKKLLLVVLVLIGLQIQAQTNNWCDFLSYSIIPNTTLTVTPSSGGIGNMVGAIDWYFTACNASTCYTSQGNNPYFFPLLNMTDTVKLCYDAFIYTLDSTTIACIYCDSLVYDFNLFIWVILYSNAPTSINELTINKINNNKIYDLLGRELFYIPRGTMYIQNRKLKINK
jgi:hypothetical protein